MTDDVLINKATTIKRCIDRIYSEYNGYEEIFLTNMTKQDSIILNIQRACEAAIDMGVRYVRIHKFRIPENGRDVFQVLAEEGILSLNLSNNLKAMVGFRNIAVYDYQSLDLTIVQKIIKEQLQEFIDFCNCLLKNN